MEIIKIVLTGGPCGGKTTALNAIKKYLEAKNIPAVYLPEVATKLINSGIKPNDMNMFDFQKLVLGSQLHEENEAKKYLKKQYPDNGIGVIICDRGIFDNKAYLDSRLAFGILLRMFNLSEIKYLDNYNMVLNLLSVATCKKEAYTLLNNEARMEDINTATMLDIKTSNAWANHYNMKVLESNIPIEDEIKIIINHIDNLLEGDNISYIDRYLINPKESDVDKYFKDYDYVLCEENYLDFNYNGYTSRITIRKKNGVTDLLEVYKEVDGKKINIYTKLLPRESTSALLKKYGCKDVTINREKGFVQDRHLYKLHESENKVILDVYKNNIYDNVILPEDLKGERIPSPEFTIDKEERNRVIKLLKR